MKKLGKDLQIGDRVKRHVCDLLPGMTDVTWSTVIRFEDYTGRVLNYTGRRVAVYNDWKIGDIIDPSIYYEVTE